jgi:hypothetical protein
VAELLGLWRGAVDDVELEAVGFRLYEAGRRDVGNDVEGLSIFTLGSQWVMICSDLQVFWTLLPSCAWGVSCQCDSV